jgi:hypothetical protein
MNGCDFENGVCRRWNPCTDECKDRAGFAQATAPQEVQQEVTDNCQKCGKKIVGDAVRCVHGRNCWVGQQAASQSQAPAAGGEPTSDEIYSLADAHAQRSAANGNRTFDRGGLRQFAHDLVRRYAAPQPSPAGATEPPLTGRWHHGNGALVSGGVRIAAWDCDNNPPTEFRERMLDWMCATLNAAVARWESTAPDEFAAAITKETP